VHATRAARAAGRAGVLLGLPLLSAALPAKAAATLAPARAVERLLAARSGTPGARLRVLHLGDSHVSAAPLGGTLRDLLGALAGGPAGTGLLFPGLPFNATRGRGATVRLSPGWTKVYGREPLPPDGMGLAGGFAEARRAGARLEVDASFAVLRLHLLRQPGGGTALVRVDGRLVGRVDLDGPADLALFRWSGGGASRLEVEAADGLPVRVLGVALEGDGPGLVYSPAGVVGAQANVLLRCREDLFARQLAAEAPDVVILAFGTNEARDSGFDAVAYVATLEALVGRVRRGAPSALVLLAGPPDQERATRGGARPVATLPLVVEAQREAARRTGAAFLDLREAMGGGGSVRRWFRASPPLAQPDLVHFTAPGYERLARLVAGALVASFEGARLRVASAERPIVLPEARVASNAPTREARAPSAPEDESGLRSYRDASGRLVLTNLDVAPLRTPELGRVGGTRR
jgi:lysophospholipase L1-like esterase